MLPPTIARLTESNISGGCYLQLVKASLVDQMPEEVNGTIAAAITLLSGYWTEVRPTVFTQDFDEEWKRVDGAQVAVATLECVIPKDRAILLHELWKLHTGRYLVLHHDKNGTMKLMGTKEEPAIVRMVKLQHGTRIGADRNQYLLQVTVTRRRECPFYGADPPTSTPAECPTLAEQIAAVDWATIEALLDAGQLADAVASICDSCPTLAELIAATDWATIESHLNGTQTDDAVASLCETMCSLIEAAFLEGGTGELELTVGATSGELTETGTLNGKPLYFILDWASTGFSAEAYWTGTEWYLTNGVLEWTSSEDVATPADVVTWAGDSPLPTVAEGNSGAQTVADCVPLDQVNALITALGGFTSCATLVEQLTDATAAEIETALIAAGQLEAVQVEICEVTGGTDRYYAIAIGHP